VVKNGGILGEEIFACPRFSAAEFRASEAGTSLKIIKSP